MVLDIAWYACKIGGRCRPGFVEDAWKWAISVAVVVLLVCVGSIFYIFSKDNAIDKIYYLVYLVMSGFLAVADIVILSITGSGNDRRAMLIAGICTAVPLLPLSLTVFVAFCL